MFVHNMYRMLQRVQLYDFNCFKLIKQTIFMIESKTFLNENCSKNVEITQGSGYHTDQLRPANNVEIRQVFSFNRSPLDRFDCTYTLVDAICTTSYQHV